MISYFVLFLFSDVRLLSYPTFLSRPAVQSTRVLYILFMFINSQLSISSEFQSCDCTFGLPALCKKRFGDTKMRNLYILSSYMARIIKKENKIYKIKTIHCLLLRFGRMNSSSDYKTIRPPNALPNKKTFDLYTIASVCVVCIGLVSFWYIDSSDNKFRSGVLIFAWGWLTPWWSF